MSYPARALDVAKNVAIEAGSMLKKAFSTENYELKLKDDGSPVTTADVYSQQIIKERLTDNFPDIPVFGEEDQILDKPASIHECYWFVDPLDGTKEFIKKSIEFTVNIALVYRKRPVLGVISHPLANTLYYAEKGGGSYKRVNDKSAQIKVSQRVLAEAIVVESRDHTPSTQRLLMDKLPYTSKFEAGSSIKGCYVAEGKADLYMRLSPFWYWDACAQDCIVTEAGGSFTTLTGEQIEYLPQAATVSGAVASNGVFHQNIITELSALTAKFDNQP